MQQPDSTPSPISENSIYTALIEKILKEYTCIITGEIIFVPVKADDGKTYEQEAIEEHIKKRKEAIEEQINKDKKKVIVLESPLRTTISEKLTPDIDAKNIISHILTTYPDYWENVYVTNASVAEIINNINTKNFNALPDLIKEYNPYALLKQHTKHNPETILEKICTQAPPFILNKIILISI